MTRDALAKYLTENVWQRRGVLAWCLYPFSLLYTAVVMARRALYQRGILKVRQWNVPLIVVGNLSVGGTGKTPLVIRIVEYLQQQGRRPGVVSRGYGGSARHWPQFVDHRSDPRYAGDEPVMIARRTGVPVLVDPDRARAVDSLLAMGECDVVISDDGLQHHRMGRDLNIVVVDGQRRAGNGWCLPAGPLREPWTGLALADLVVCNGGQPAAGEFAMRLAASDAVNLADPQQRRALGEFQGVTVHAVAGIGVPQRFFAMLAEHGIEATGHPFADHHPFSPLDIMPFKNDPVLMTEKDAIKCQGFATENLWYVPVTANIGTEFFTELTNRLQYDRQEAA